MKSSSVGQADSNSDNQVKTVALENTTSSLEQNTTQTTPVGIANVSDTILRQSAQEQEQANRPRAIELLDGQTESGGGGG